MAEVHTNNPGDARHGELDMVVDNHADTGSPAGVTHRNNSCPQFCDACFSGEYPVRPRDMIEKGFELKAAE